MICLWTLSTDTDLNWKKKKKGVQQKSTFTHSYWSNVVPDGRASSTVRRTKLLTAVNSILRSLHSCTLVCYYYTEQVYRLYRWSLSVAFLHRIHSKVKYYAMMVLFQVRINLFVFTHSTTTPSNDECTAEFIMYLIRLSWSPSKILPWYL